MRHAGWTTRLRALVRDQNGATAIEYAIVAAGVGAVVAATVYALGNQISANFYDQLLKVLGG